ncbi:MAG: AMP-binding protein [Acidimicrobiales bacterium]|nr:AMP-binding protein [Acidimicrobiales bacterium]
MRELVALDLPGGPAFVDALRRAWDDGDAVLPLDRRLPLAARRRLVAALAPSVVVDGSGPQRIGADSAGVPVENGDALVLATSGTTGDPKGVVLTQDAVAAAARATSQHLGIDPARHHWLACLPLAHIGGLSVVCRALWAGTALTVTDGFDVESALASGASHVSLVTTALVRLGERAAAFERIVLGGSAPPTRRAATVVCTYGMTETGSGVVYDGWALPTVEVREVDGELQLRGPMLLRAYRDGTDPRTADGWLPTGDGGRVDTATGFVEVYGRRGDLIITGGQNVWPDQVERLLDKLPGVAEVAVVGRPDPEWGQVVTAVIVPAADAAVPPPSLDAVRDAVKAELPAYCAPRAVELAEDLPRTTLGKVRRALL